MRTYKSYPTKLTSWESEINPWTKLNYWLRKPLPNCQKNFAVPTPNRTLNHLLQLSLLFEESVVKSYQKANATAEEVFAALPRPRKRIISWKARRHRQKIKTMELTTIHGPDVNIAKLLPTRCNTVASSIDTQALKEAIDRTKLFFHRPHSTLKARLHFLLIPVKPITCVTKEISSSPLNRLNEEVGLSHKQCSMFPFFALVQINPLSVGIGDTKLDVLGLGKFTISVKV